jgi:class 3 adenylate cyclase/tetratricopeptide (TPR) repeat protein
MQATATEAAVRSAEAIDGRYVPALVREWVSRPAAEAFRVLEGSLLFLDLSGFTRISERLARRGGRLGAEEVTDVVNRYFATLLSAAQRDGADVLKFGGDALLLLFTGERHAEYATHAAAVARSALRRLGRQHTSAGDVSLRMSGAIASGAIHAFLAGDRHRELVIAGPGPSAVVELESAARAGQILLSEETAALLPSGVVGRRVADGRLLQRASLLDVAPVAARAADAADCSLGVPVAMRSYLGASHHASEHRQIATTFIRFSGVDALLREGSVEEVASELDALICAAQRITDEYELCFVQTDVDRDGGKVLLVAGAPTSHDDDLERILLATQELVATAPTRFPLQAGLTDGRVFAGEVGTPERSAYTVMGDSVNLAARLMSHARPGQLLAARDCLVRSRVAFETRELAPLVVKGKARPVEASEVGRPSSRALGGTAARGPLIGRDRELAAIIDQAAAAIRGSGIVVEISGEPGIGKSRLLDEVAERIPIHLQLRSRCGPYAASTPYFAFRSLLRGALRLPPDASAGAAGSALAAWVAGNAPALTPWLPLLAIAMSADSSSTPEVEQLDPAFRRARLHAVVLDFLRVALPEPALLTIEDIHWIDEPSGELLSYLAANLERAPWMICVTRRPAEGRGRAQLSGATRIPLQALSAETAKTLAYSATEADLLPAHITEALVERSEGNPLFLFELLSAAQQAVDLEELPPGVEAVIAAKIDRLHPDDRHLLRLAAAIGLSVDASLLAAALGAEAPALDQPATWAALGDFVERREDGSLQFRHAIVRDVAYEGLPFGRRRELHRRVGELLEQRGGAVAEGYLELLAIHFSRAQFHAKAWRYSTQAAQHARAQFANVEAAAFLKQSLRAARRIEVPASARADAWETLGDVSEQLGLYDDASRAFAEALRALGGDRIAQLRLFRKQGELREHRGQYTQALRWYGRALRRVGESRRPSAETAQRAELELAYAGVRLRQGKHRDCVRWSQRALSDAERSGNQRAIAYAYYLLDAGYTNLGDEQALAFRDRALPIFRAVGDLQMEARALNNLGYNAAMAEGRLREGLAHFEESLAAKERLGDVVGAALTKQNIAEVLSDQGDLDRAAVLLEEVLRAWRGAGYLLGVATATSNLGRLEGRRGNFDGARRLLLEAQRQLTEIQAAEGLQLQYARSRLAELYVAMDEPERALPIVHDALVRTGDADLFPGARAMLRRLEGFASWQLGRVASAREHIELGLSAARESGHAYEEAVTLDALLRLLDASGDPAASSYRRLAEERLHAVGATRPPAAPLPAATQRGPRVGSEADLSPLSPDRA